MILIEGGRSGFKPDHLIGSVAIHACSIGSASRQGWSCLGSAQLIEFITQSFMLWSWCVRRRRRRLLALALLPQNLPLRNIVGVLFFLSLR